MKFKYFLRGLGTGIIFASIILLVVCRGESSNKMTDAEIIKKAKELGMEEKQDPVKDLLSTTEDTTKKADSKNDKKEDADSTSEEKSTEEVTTEQTTEATTEAETQEETTTEQTSEKQQVTITIEGGDTSYPICQKLQELGLIESAAEFDSYMIDNGYASRLRVGTHTLTYGMTFQEIAEAISDPIS